MTTILHCYTKVRVEDQIQTWEAIDKLITNHAIPIISKECIGEDGYWKVLMEYWGKSDLVIIEQDIVPTLASLLSMLSCSAPACTTPYRLVDGKWSISTSSFGAVVFYDANGPTRLGDLQAISMKSYESPLPNLAQMSALGFVKISKELQRVIKLDQYPVYGHSWKLMDMYISAFMSVRLNQQMWHVHIPDQPIKHNHYL